MRGIPGHPRAITRLQQGVREAAAPRMETKFKILKRFKRLYKESIFQKREPFFLHENSFNKEKFRKIEILLLEIFTFYGVTL